MKILRTSIYFNDKDQTLRTSTIFRYGTFSHPGGNYRIIAESNSIEATLFKNMIAARLNNGQHFTCDDLVREWHYFSFIIAGCCFMVDNYPVLNPHPDYKVVQDMGIRINSPSYMTDPDGYNEDMRHQ